MALDWMYNTTDTEEDRRRKDELFQSSFGSSSVIVPQPSKKVSIAPQPAARITPQRIEKPSFLEAIKMGIAGKKEVQRRSASGIGSLFSGGEKTEAEKAEAAARTGTVSFKEEAKRAYRSSFDEIAGDLKRLKDIGDEKVNPLSDPLQPFRGALAMGGLAIDAVVEPIKFGTTAMFAGIADLINQDKKRFDSTLSGVDFGGEIAPFIAAGIATGGISSVGAGGALIETTGGKVATQFIANLLLDTAIVAADNPDEIEAADLAGIAFGNLIGAGFAGRSLSKQTKAITAAVKEDLTNISLKEFFNGPNFGNAYKDKLASTNPYKLNFIENLQSTPGKLDTPIRLTKAINASEDTTIGAPKLPDQFYKNAVKVIKETKKPSSIGKGARGLADMVGDAINPISYELEKISPGLFSGLRGLEFESRVNPMKDIEEVMPFLKAIQKFNKEDDIIRRMAMLNGDDETIKRLLSKYGFDEALAPTRKVLDNLHALQANAGIDIGYNAGYFSRHMNDVPGYLKSIEGTETAGIIQKAITNKEKAIGRALSEQERETVINSLLRGYQTNNITLSKLGSMKSRNIGTITPELAQFYDDPAKGLISYIEKSHEAILIRKFFGKESTELTSLYGTRNRLATNISKAKNLKLGDKGFKSKNTRIEGLQRSLDETNDSITKLLAKDEGSELKSIGRFVDDLLEKGEIDSAQQIKIKELLNARFNTAQTSGWVNAVKSLGYLTTLANPASAVRNLGDLAITNYKNGLFRTTVSGLRALVGMPKIKIKDIGIDEIGAEFKGMGRLQKAVDFSLKASLFSFFDKLGKTVHINASLSRFQKQSKKPTADFMKEISRVFGEETEAVMKDLQSGVISQDVKRLLFSDILDIQPIAKSEMPLQYLNSPNGRLLYTMKSFQIKQLNFARKETYDVIAAGIRNGSAKQVAKGMKNLVRLGYSLSLMGVGTDFVTSLMTNREFKTADIADSVVDNLLRFAFLSKYNLERAKQTGIREIVAGLVIPPTQFIDNLIKDTANFKKIEGIDDLDSLQSVPVVGKELYWWVGKGAKKSQKRGEALFDPPRGRRGGFSR